LTLFARLWTNSLRANKIRIICVASCDTSGLFRTIWSTPYMKFNKPINRDIEIGDSTFVVTMDDTGVSFRVKGKRKSLRADWPAVLFIARGDAADVARPEHGHESGPGSAQEPDETTAPGMISRQASAGEGTPES
jgi:hypothetical protein